MNAQHTPAPWRIATETDPHDGEQLYYVHADTGGPTCCGQHVARLCHWGSWDREARANAALIAAAPELLAALEDVTRELDRLQPVYCTDVGDEDTWRAVYGPYLDAARAAIARAKEEQP